MVPILTALLTLSAMISPLLQCERSLAIVQNRLRCSLVQLKLRAHFLQTSSKGRNLLLQLLHFAMLFEKFVEQHRVYRFVAHSVGLALLVASNQIGVNLLHFFGHEAELRDTRGVKLVLVAEGHWLKRQDRFARLVHWLDRVLETVRGDDRAEVTAGIDNNPDAARHRYPA